MLSDSSVWREAERNETHVFWRRSDTERYCVSMIDGKRPSEGCEGYEGYPTVGRRGYITSAGTDCGYVPRESVDATRECVNCDARPGMLSPEGLCNDCHITAAHRAEAAVKPTCSKCSATFKPNDYSSSTKKCGYCAHTEQLSHAVDTTPAMNLLRTESKRKASRHDARPLDLEQAWSTPGWES